MFENSNFAVPLDEERFDDWLVQGRESKIRYSHIIILWDELQKDYCPVYLSDRSEITKYQEKSNTASDVVVAVYDLYTESKIF